MSVHFINRAVAKKAEVVIVDETRGERGRGTSLVSTRLCVLC